MSLPASESNNWDQAVHLPDYVDREQASEVLRRLTDAGKRQFDADLRAAEAEGPERVHAVVYSWYRTAQHVDAPGFLDAVAKARAEVQTARPWAAADMEELRRLADSGSSTAPTGSAAHADWRDPRGTPRSPTDLSLRRPAARPRSVP